MAQMMPQGRGGAGDAGGGRHDRTGDPRGWRLWRSGGANPMCGSAGVGESGEREHGSSAWAPVAGLLPQWETMFVVVTALRLQEVPAILG